LRDHLSVRRRRPVLHDDGFGDAVMHALAVDVDEVLDESEAAFEGRGSVAESTLDGLPERDFGVLEGDDADVQQTLAKSESIGAPDGESGIDDEVREVCEFVKAEVNRDLDGMVRGFEFEVLAGDLNRDIDDEDDEEVYYEGGKTLPEGGERTSGERLQTWSLVGIEEARRPRDGESPRKFHG